jgi:hypothetical protein
MGSFTSYLKLDEALPNTQGAGLADHCRINPSPFGKTCPLYSFI